MFVHLLRLLGVTPTAEGKTGKREAAWMTVAITLAVTLYAMHAGPDMVREMSPILMVMWPSAFALLGAAYKLEWDQAKARGAAPEAGPAADWEAGASEGLVG